MHLDAPTLWWIAAGVLVAIELASGTFYLLMLSLGAVAAAVSASLGATLVGQLVVAALVGGGAVALWHRHNRRRPPAAPVKSNRDVHLDVGSTVHVERWTPEGTARVTYRGAGWDARHVGADAPAPGDHVVRGIDGNRLMLERVKS